MAIETFEIPKIWYDIIQQNRESLEFKDEFWEMQETIEQGITVYAFHHILEKQLNADIPQFDPYPIRQRCIFLKQFNYTEIGDTFKKWEECFRKKIEIPQWPQGKTAWYDTTDALRKSIDQQFKDGPNTKISLNLEIQRRVIDIYCQKYNIPLEQALIIFYQCGLACYASQDWPKPFNTIFEIFEAIHGADVSCNWTGSHNGTEFKTITDYRFREDDHGLHLHIVNQMCRFNELKGHL